MNNLIEKLPLVAIARDFALGNDIVHLPDFTASFNQLFRDKVFTEQEIHYCELFDQSILRYASTWAAKEAVYKAVKQLSEGSLPFKKIEIVRSKPGGIPTVILPEELSGYDISLTITHDGDYVWAAALVKTSES